MICCSDKEGHSGCLHGVSACHSNCITAAIVSQFQQFPVSCPAVIGELTDTLQVRLHSVVTNDQMVYSCVSHSCV